MTNLQTLNLKEISKIATENGITLSYKAEDGKRKRFTKEDLICKIETLEVLKVEEVNVTKIENSTIYGAVTSSNLTHTLSVDQTIELLKVEEVVTYCIKTLKTITDVTILKEFKQTVIKSFSAKLDNKKRSLKSKWSMQNNRLNMLFKQYENKLSNIK